MSNTPPESRIGTYNPHVQPNSHFGEAPGQIVTERLDRVFRAHEKEMWQASQIDFGKLQPKMLTEDEVAALRGAVLTTALFGGETSRRLAYFREDHEVTTFSPIQSYEELKQHAVLQAYLAETGLVDREDLAKELDLVVGRWREEESLTLVQIYTKEMMQKKLTGVFFEGLAKSTKEPLLGEILSPMIQDSFRDSQYYMEKGGEVVAADESGTAMGEVEEFLLDQMLGPRSMFVESYAQTMSRVGLLDQTALGASLEQLAQLIGRENLLRISADRRFRSRIQDQWGVELPKVA